MDYLVWKKNENEVNLLHPVNKNSIYKICILKP